MTYEMFSLDVANLIIYILKNGEKLKKIVFFFIHFLKKNINLNFATKKNWFLLKLVWKSKL
jgi:hypothetical protein